MTDSNSKLGTLAARVIVDRGNRAHYGPEDAITGKVVIKYHAYTSFIKKSPGTLDYFGPLKIEVVLRGKVRVKIKRSSGNSHITSDYGTRLFLQNFNVYEGSFKAEVGQEQEFPFSINFPESALDSPLPPSTTAYFHDYPDRVDSAVAYRLGVELRPGVKIDTSLPDRWGQPEVKYDLPRPSQSTFDKAIETVQQRTIVRTKYLLPEEERPSGFKQNLKAAFSSNSDLPTFVANVTCTTLPQAYAGLRPSFSLSVRRVDKDTTAPFFPEAVLHSFGINLIAHTEVDTSERIISSKTVSDASSVQKLKPSQEGSSPLPVSFSKANDYSVEVVLEPFGSHCSTFSHPKISRKYVLEIKAGFKIAEQTISLYKQWEILMIPPPVQKGPGASDPSQPVEAGPSRTTVDDEMDQPPPAYDDALASGESARVKSEEG